jgi:hypothetical protein
MVTREPPAERYDAVAKRQTADRHQSIKPQSGRLN